MPDLHALVVDPNPLTHRRVEEALAGTRYTLLPARDAVEASARAEEADELAVAFVSASLPRGNGYDLARALRERHPAAAVFILAGGFEVFNPVRAEEAGVTGHIPKPFTVQGLRSRLEEVVGPLVEASPAVEARETEPSSSGTDEPPIYDGPIAPLADDEPHRRGPWRPLSSDERIATLLPRDYEQVPVVAVDPTVVGPAVEKAILEVLPEIVEVVLRHALMSSGDFRDLVEVAVDEAVRNQLPSIARRVVEERLAEIEARGADDID